MTIDKLPLEWQLYIADLEGRVHELNMYLFIWGAVAVGVIGGCCFVATLLRKQPATNLLSARDGLTLHRVLTQFARQNHVIEENLELGIAVIGNVVAVSMTEYRTFAGVSVMAPVARANVLQDVRLGNGAAFRIKPDRSVVLLSLEDFNAWREGVPTEIATRAAC